MNLNRRHFLATGALAVPALAATSSASAAENGSKGPSLPSEAESESKGPLLRTGAEVLAAQGWRRLAGRRVGVLSNPTGVLAGGEHIVDSMVAAGIRPVAAFGPEHGFRGSAQAGGSEGDYTDPRTGIPVYDAYGVDAAKLAGMFTKAGVDTVVFDIADVGARFYTYIWSLYTAQVAAARVGAALLVLDRPNPLGGKVSGPVLDPKFASGVGRKPIAQQHGMTVGELARFFAAEFLPGEGVKPGELEVVEVRGWRRDAVFARTGLDWVPPSPNMPTPDTALVYPGTGMFEGTVFSEGRGTTRPFEILGAPGLDWRWREKLASLGLPGVRFRETYFVPTFGKFVNQTCGGVQLTVTDSREFDAIRTAVAMFVTARALHPDKFGWRPDHYIDLLSGSDRLRTKVDAGAGVDEITASWRAELAEFDRKRRRHLLYR
ncbi:exo-beta-N-acetylmuramidase NamZ domain-containing protein [Amycolatopsis sp. NPDC059027]|uniref:exo-beta-N-acetylmuramidase NamZ family protein n=1 Tax=Amycolatopsis sp. NPDC059027 TaxID=3346709 RepID=UPI00367037FC